MAPAATAKNFIIGMGLLLQQDKTVAKGFDAVFEFQMGDEVFTVDFTGRKSYVGSSGKADCTFIISQKDFMLMITKESDAMELFMSQKLKLEGDMGLAMQFGEETENLTTELVLGALSKQAKL